MISADIKNFTSPNIKCNFIPNSVLEKPTAISFPVTEGTFAQNLNITKTTFLSFEDEKSYYSGFIQPGDSIVITYDAERFRNTLSFSGKGKEKFILTDSIMLIRSVFDKEHKKIKGLRFPVDYLFNKIDSLQHTLVQRLSFYKSSMTDESFKLLNALIEANVLRAKYNGILNIFGDSYDDILKKQQSRLTVKSKKAIQNLLRFKDNLAYFYFYASNVAGVFSVYYDDNIKPSIGEDLQLKYAYLSKQLPLNLKSPVLFLLMEQEVRQNKEATIGPIIEQYFAFPKDSVYRNFITRKLTNARELKNGIAAPDFSLENINGEKIQLSSFKGKVIYMDFWFAACGPCHKLFNDIKSVKDYFKSDTNVVFLNISVDNREVWKTALKKFNINGYHAFTEDKFRDHAIVRKYNVNEYPTTFIIGKNGEMLNVRPSHHPNDLKKELESASKAQRN